MDESVARKPEHTRPIDIDKWEYNPDNPICRWCGVEIFKVRILAPQANNRVLKFCCDEHGRLDKNEELKWNRRETKKTYVPRCKQCNADILKVQGIDRADVSMHKLKKMFFCNDTCKREYIPPEEEKVPRQQKKDSFTASDLQHMQVGRMINAIDEITKGNARYVIPKTFKYGVEQ